MRRLMHTGWAVDSVDPTAYNVNARGDAVYGARVMFHTSAGNGGSVFVDNANLSVDNVTAEINKRAALMDAIATLQSPPGEVEF